MLQLPMKSVNNMGALALAFSKNIPGDVDNISAGATDSHTDALEMLGFIAMKNLPLDLFKDMTDLPTDV